jgi:hypothetical protein
MCGEGVVAFLLEIIVGAHNYDIMVYKAISSTVDMVAAVHITAAVGFSGPPRLRALAYYIIFKIHKSIF